MTDENNPDIYIEYSAEAFPPSNWETLKTYALEFNVKNSGISKIPEATLVLKNTGGRYTGGGSLTLGLHKLLRIRADVRGTIDTLFYGRTTTPETNNKDDKREILTVTARGIIGQKLLRDSITKKYLEEQNTSGFKDLPTGETEWTMRAIIKHLLWKPDTTYDTGITLATDAGDITTVKAKHNFDRETLLDAVQKVCEYIGYGGYEEISGSALNLCLYPYGWEPTNPAITIGQDSDDLGNQVLERSFEKTVDELYNHIMIWAASQIMYPDSDRFTENGVSKGYWTALNSNTTVSDETINRINQKCIKIINISGGAPTPDVLLDLTSVFPNGLNVANKLITKLVFDFFGQDDYGNADGELHITLRDTQTPYCYVTWRGAWHLQICDDTHWATYTVPLGDIKNGVFIRPPHGHNLTELDEGWSGDGQNNWSEHSHIGAPEDFNWIITKIRLRGLPKTSRIDGLHFEGAIPVNPIEDPSLAATDPTSIDLYGRSVMHYDEPALKDYEAIKPLADKILESTKNPMIKLKVKVGAKTWVKPNQYLVANMPIYGISNEQYRIVEVGYDWKTSTKVLRSTLNLTPRTQPVTSREWYAFQLEGILKNLIW